ncbi:MAG: class I SAM-dependent methyltransferase [Thermodesulfobacteriota bacterium]
MDKHSIYDQENYVVEYEEDRYGGSFGRYLRDIEVKNFSSFIEATHNRVLDVGAGTGKLCIPLSSQSREVIALDLSKEMIRISKMNADIEDVRIMTVVCDAEQLCFDDKTFDCVVSSRLLMHLTDWRNGISEMCRVSKFLLIIEFPPFSSFAVIDSFFKKLEKFFISSTQTYKTFLIKSVIEELKRNQFEVVTVNRQFFLPIIVHRWFNNPWLSKRIENLCKMTGLIRLMGAPVTVKAVRKNQ